MIIVIWQCYKTESALPTRSYSKGGVTEIFMGFQVLAEVGDNPQHQFLVAPGVGHELADQRLLVPENWFLTLGDFDADAYAD